MPLNWDIYSVQSQENKHYKFESLKWSQFLCYDTNCIIFKCYFTNNEYCNCWYASSTVTIICCGNWLRLFIAAVSCSHQQEIGVGKLLLLEYQKLLHNMYLLWSYILLQMLVTCIWCWCLFISRSYVLSVFLLYYLLLHVRNVKYFSLFEKTPR